MAEPSVLFALRNRSPRESAEDAFSYGILHVFFRFIQMWDDFSGQANPLRFSFSTCHRLVL
jgi:hypothetical protein